MSKYLFGQIQIFLIQYQRNPSTPLSPTSKFHILLIQYESMFHRSLNQISPEASNIHKRASNFFDHLMGDPKYSPETPNIHLRAQIFIRDPNYLSETPNIDLRPFHLSWVSLLSVLDCIASRRTSGGIKSVGRTTFRRSWIDAGVLKMRGDLSFHQGDLFLFNFYIFISWQNIRYMQLTCAK